MNAFVVIGTILFITSLGFVIIRGYNLLPKKEFLTTVALGYGLGVGIVSIQLYFYAYLGIPWSALFLITPLIIFILSTFFLRRDAFRFKVSKIPELSLFEKLLLVGICLTLAYVMFEALLRPVTVWDGWAIWLLKSKMFFISEFIFMIGNLYGVLEICNLACSR